VKTLGVNEIGYEQEFEVLVEASASVQEFVFLCGEILEVVWALLVAAVVLQEARQTHQLELVMRRTMEIHLSYLTVSEYSGESCVNAKEIGLLLHQYRAIQCLQER